MKRVKQYRELLIGALLLCFGQLLAQEQETVYPMMSDTIRYESAPLLQIPKAASVIAASSTSGESMRRTTSANLTKSLSGQLNGLTVLQGSGEPGYDVASLYIRGLGSYNYGRLNIFIDGYQSDLSYFQYLSPEEIEEVTILKDAAALSTFGMKGANGVLWVTTQRGNIGKPKVKFQLQSGLQKPIVLNKPLSSYDYATLYNEAYSNDKGMWLPYYSDFDMEELKNGNGVNTDWYRTVLRQTSPLSRIEASVKGGSEAARYFVLLGYMNNRGLYNVKKDETHSNADFTQFNVRTNIDFNLFGIFEGRVNIGGRTESRRFPNYTGWNLWQNLAGYPSIIYRPVNDDGSYPGTMVYPDNPLASIRELGYTSTHDRSLLANVDVKENLDFLLEGLYLFQGISFNTWTRGSYNVTKNYARNLDGVLQTLDQNTNYVVYDDKGTAQWNRLQFQVGLGHQFKIHNRHNLQSAVTLLQNIYRVDANDNGEAGIHTTYANSNVSGRIHYDWDNRYIAEFGFAYSGSDNYRKGNRFGFYPTFALGWNVLNPNLTNANRLLNGFKIRASVGTSGDDSYSGERYLYQKYYSNFGGGGFATGTDELKWHNGLGLQYVPNPDIFAEKSTKFNVGIDSKYLNNTLFFQIDAFADKRTGIVTPDNSLMGIFGAKPPYMNIGKVTIHGVELVLDYLKQLGSLTLNVGATMAYANNTIDYMAEFTALTPESSLTGKPIGIRIGYEAIGFYDISDFNTDGTLKDGLPKPLFGVVRPGDVKYRNVNGDNVINDFDKVEIGNSFIPTFNYSGYISLVFKGIDLRMLLQGVAGNTVNLLDARRQIIAFENNGNAYEIARKRWAYYPEQGIDTRSMASYPRLSLETNNNNYQYSSLWIVDGSYWRIKNLELGYSLPIAWLRRVSLSSVRIFTNFVNLFTHSHLLKEYKLDPEVMSGYPALKSANLGISVQF